MRRNTASVHEIAAHLHECSNYFAEPLSDRLNIEGYAIKISTNAETFEAWCTNRLIGLIAAYIPLESRIAYITNVSVVADYGGQGIGGALLAACIEHAKGVGASEIELEVHKSSTNATSLYSNHGFQCISVRGPYQIMKRELKT